jgi:hypothetical protein
MVAALARRIVLAALIGVLGLVAAPATAAPAPLQPNALTISGEGLLEPVVLEAESEPELFAAVLDQVSWLRGQGHPAPPKDEDLGPKYTVVLLIDHVAVGTYDLYPLAPGGPRAYRPAEQPDDRKTSPAWFFGRLNMPEALRAAGAPLSARHDVLSGDYRRSERVITDGIFGADEQLDGVISDLRRVMLLDAAVVLAIAVGLVGISLLVRRRGR